MRSGRLAGRLLAFALGVALAAPASSSQRFVGDWLRSETRRSDDAAALESEIERATASLSFWLRGIARAYLRRHVRPTEHYRIAREGEVLWIRALDDGSRWRVDGVTQHRDTGAVTSRQEAPGRILQTWSHGDTHGTTVWQLDPSGDALTVSVTAHEARLPEPLHYTTHYERSAR